jgi:hypothetical protein
LPRGTEICREAPFIHVHHPITTLSIQTRFDALPPDGKTLFLSFSGTIPPDEIPNVMVNIAETNCMDLRNREDEEDIDDGESDFGHGQGTSKETAINIEKLEEIHSGLFEHISRVNHSCRPNSGWSWDEENQQMGESPSASSARWTFSADANYQP